MSAIPFIDTKLKVDDPVGAISVHGICGLWGTIAVGLFASDTSAGAELLGLFYGGGLKALGVQALGAVSLIAWAAIIGSILFVVLKKAGLLRAKPQEELKVLTQQNMVLHQHMQTSFRQHHHMQVRAKAQLIYQM